jgi:hypothetical protein
MSEVVPANDGLPLGYLVEMLSADRASVASLARILTGVLADALPAGMVRVDFERSLSDRMHGRTGEPVGVTVELGDQVLTMRAERGRVEAVVARAVRGVVLSRKPVSVSEWVATLAQTIRELAQQDAAARSALQRLLLD